MVHTVEEEDKDPDQRDTVLAAGCNSPSEVRAGSSFAEVAAVDNRAPGRVVGPLGKAMGNHPHRRV